MDFIDSTRIIIRRITLAYAIPLTHTCLLLTDFNDFQHHYLLRIDYNSLYSYIQTLRSLRKWDLTTNLQKYIFRLVSYRKKMQNSVDIKFLRNLFWQLTIENRQTWNTMFVNSETLEDKFKFIYFFTILWTIFVAWVEC